VILFKRRLGNERRGGGEVRRSSRVGKGKVEGEEVGDREGKEK